MALDFELTSLCVLLPREQMHQLCVLSICRQQTLEKLVVKPECLQCAQLHVGTLGASSDTCNICVCRATVQ